MQNLPSLLQVVHPASPLANAATKSHRGDVTSVPDDLGVTVVPHEQRCESHPITVAVQGEQGYIPLLL